jgi:hypothetical protein
MGRPYLRARWERPRSRDRDDARSADNSARTRGEEHLSRSRLGGGASLGDEDRNETITEAPSPPGDESARARRGRAWGAFAIVVALTTFTLVLVAPALIAPYFSLVAGVLLLPRRSAGNRAIEAQPRQTDDDATRETSDFKCAAPTMNPSPTDNPPAPESTAESRALKTRRARARSRSKAKVEAVPAVVAATWIRVGPGKFVRVESAESELGIDGRTGPGPIDEETLTDVHSQDIGTRESGCQNDLVQGLHASAEKDLGLSENIATARPDGVSYIKDRAVIDVETDERPSEELDGQNSSERHEVRGVIGVSDEGAISVIHGWTHSADSFVHHAETPPEALAEGRTSAEPEVSSMFLRRAREEHQFDSPGAWDQELVDRTPEPIHAQSEADGGPSRGQDGAHLDCVRALSEGCTAALQDDGGHADSDPVAVDDADTAEVGEYSDDDAGEEGDAGTLVSPRCRPWPRVRPTSSRRMESLQRGRDPRPSRSSTPGWVVRSANRRGPVSRHRLSRPSAF